MVSSFHCRTKKKLPSNTFLLVQFTRIGNDDLGLGLAALRAIRLHLLHHVQSLDDLPEHDVLPVQPLRFDGAQEELAAVGVGPGVGHREDSGSGVLQLEVLVLKFVSVDGLSAGAVVVGEVTALAHELRNDAVEGAGLEAEALLAGAQGAEVLRGLGHNIAAQLHDDPPDRGTVRGDVHKNARQRHGAESLLAEDRTAQTSTLNRANKPGP